MNKGSFFHFVTLCTSVALWSQDPALDGSLERYNGFFIGVGGSYNSVSLSQTLDGTGISDIYSGATLVARGEAGGPTAPFRETETTFSPEGQIGYMQHIGDSPWFLGGKFLYQYLGLTFSNGPLDAFQKGEFTNLSDVNTFIGNSIIQSSQSLLNHELVLMPFFCYSIDRTHFYLGGGVSVFQANFYQYNFVGFADINGNHNDITGSPINLSDSLWMWGGGAQIGAKHFFNPNWFLDFSYGYFVTPKYSFNNSESFTSTTISEGDSYLNRGTAYISSSQSFILQSLTISLNYLF